MTMAPPTLAAHEPIMGTMMVQKVPMGNSPMAYTSTKGLLNGPGQNNCFLNSAVQVLWHLDIFRRSFRDLSGHACMAESCIFCALKELFSQLQYSTETALPPDALRRALAESFFDQQRFQLGFMDDAAECFENMLLRIHMHIAHGEAEDMCNAKHCIPHQKFAMTLVEQSVCKSCGATSEPLSYTQMVHYVSTSTLVYQVRTKPQGGDPFGQLLRKAGNMGDVRVCPSMCGAVIQINRTLMNHPEIVSVGLVWNSERPTLEHIMEVFASIGTTLRLGDIFTVVDQRWSENSVHDLVGVVTYYGKHYSTFFFHTKLRVWIYFDDATVREIGPKWEQVVEKCRKGRYQPLLLLYALPDGTPVNTEHAPKQITPFYNNGIKKLPLRRAVTPSPEKPIIGNTRRAITPNPDCKPPLPKQNDYQNLSVIQNSIYRGVDVVDGDPGRKNIHRTLSNGSSSGTEVYFKDYPNVPRTRDSGNWSSDRNSASSTSSTTMENPYLYLPGKAPSGSSNSSGGYDVGYDSHSLSSNDSSTITTLQHLMKMGHLAKIPEDYSSQSHQISQSCDVLCDEADELLVKSRQLEDDHDLVLALALCNAAATKARAAMDAPYNNPQTLTLARMKHNTCIMRARSLHRRMTQTPPNVKDSSMPEIRHTREGSSGSGRHSRQNSRDKTTGHSRQNSKELVEKITPKNIEIYATLPKKKDGKCKPPPVDRDEEYVLYDKPARESRSIFSRNKNKAEKRSRSEDRNKLSREEETPAPKEEKTKDKGKKQHKIRRKLMGGLMRRKNRSMPDLTETTVDTDQKTMDDSKIGLKQAPPSAMCGYLSEGHLEYSANPNLERSKLMRKSFHGSAGKILTAAKVPPPPPLRTTSQLSKMNDSIRSTASLPPKIPQDMLHGAYSQIVTRADVHHEQDHSMNCGRDEVDCLPQPHLQNLDLPPYPSPLGSAVHSRQASEEFPPPPPPLDLSALDEHLQDATSPPPGSFLALVQNKRMEILSQEDLRVNPEPVRSTGGDTWLKELQAKQAALKIKKESEGVDVVRQHYSPAELDTKKGVKELTSKFETVKVEEPPVKKDAEEEHKTKPRLGKKKSVSFCDQVILVATAEDEQDDSYIPNPILERVLRSAMNKPEAAMIRKEVALKMAEQAQQENEIYVSREMQNAERQLYGSSVQRQSPYQRIPQNSPIHIQNSSMQNSPVPLQNSMPMQNSPMPMQNSPLPMQNSSMPMQNSPIPMQNSQLPMQNSPIPLQNSSIPLQNHPNHMQNPPNHMQNNQYYLQMQKYKLPPNGFQGYQGQEPINNQYRQYPEAQFRQSPYPNTNPVYQHPPSPSPTSNYNYQQQQQLYATRQGNCDLQRPYYPSNNNVPHEEHPSYSPYQPLPNCCIEAVRQQQQEIYQRVPPPHAEQAKYNPYQQVPPPKPYVKKSVSFEAGTKGGVEPSKAVVTPIIVNNANNSVPTGKTKCNLCRKKAVVSSNLYCVDCEFYMSRFKPKR